MEKKERKVKKVITFDYIPNEFDERIREVDIYLQTGINCSESLTIEYINENEIKNKSQTNIINNNGINNKLRYQAFLKYGKNCQCCGISSRETALQVDHIKPISKYPELGNDINNLQILCETCNSGKGNWDETKHRV